MCQCAAEEGLTLEVSKFVYPMDTGACLPHNCIGTLRNTRALTHEVMGFALEFDQPRDFDAGQFILLAPEGVAGYRGYSMCNFARGGRSLDFIVKRKPDGGFSQWLFGRKRDGARVATLGPLGQATLDPALRKHLLLIARGSRHARMMSILARAKEAQYFARHRGWLFFGIRTIPNP